MKDTTKTFQNPVLQNQFNNTDMKEMKVRSQLKCKGINTYLKGCITDIFEI